MNSLPLPKKKLIEVFHSAKLDARVNILLSAAYMLHSIAYRYYDEADEILKKQGIRMSMTKKLNDNLRHAYNAYLNDFAELIQRCDAGKKEGDRMARQDYFADLDKYTPLFKAMAEALLSISPEDIERMTPENLIKDNLNEERTSHQEN